MYHYQALDHINLQELADCFNAAFSDYEQSIHFTTESLNYYLTASTVDLSLSYGALYNGQLVGFILNSSGTYNEQRVVFDAGTGIVPDHRGPALIAEKALGGTVENAKFHNSYLHPLYKIIIMYRNQNAMK